MEFLKESKMLKFSKLNSMFVILCFLIPFIIHGCTESTPKTDTSVSDEKITALIQENFDLRPAAIIRDLELRRPIYKQTAVYGHFGRTDIDLPWERTDKVDVLKAAL